MSLSETGGIKYNEVWIPQRADPYVCRSEEGDYYFTASVPAYDKVVLRSSKTLSGLAGAKEKEVWHKHESGPMSEHIWAPELHYLFGGWYLYFAAGEKEDVWKIRPYVLKCMGSNPMEDEWVECGKMQRAGEDEFSFEAFSLDATIFENKGSCYYVWAEKTGVGKQISNLYLARMESPVKLETVQVLLTTPDYDWERHGFWVNEGPAVIKRNGKIFLTYSASDTGVHYCMGMLSADEDADLLDPRVWKKERYPVLQSDYEKGIYGPGHNSFTVDEAGRDIMVYHARTETEIKGNPLYNPNRHAMLMPVNWDAEGKPVFSFANGSGDVCRTEAGNDGVCRTEAGNEGVCRTEAGSEDVCRTKAGNGAACRTEAGNEGVCRTEAGSGDVCRKENGSEDACRKEKGRAKCVS